MTANAFGATLKRLREQRHFNKRQLELVCRVPWSNLNQMEQGRRGTPEPSTLLALAGALDLTNEERGELVRAGLADAMDKEIDRFATHLLVLLDKEDGTREEVRRSLRCYLVSELGRKPLAPQTDA